MLMIRAAAIAMALTMAVATAGAETGAVRLDVAGDRCDAAQVTARVVELLGHDPFVDTATRIVRIETRTSIDGVEARIYVDDGRGATRGPRILTAATCDTLLEAAALVVAVSIPSAAQEAVEPPRTASPAASTPRDGSLGVRSMSSPAPRRPIATSLITAGGLGVSGGTLRPQLLAGVQARRGERSLTAELRIDLPEDRPVTGTANVTVWATALSISPCVHVGSVALCGLATAGLIHGSGDGLFDSRRATTPMLAAGARVALERALTSRVKFRLHVDTSAVLTRTEFDVDHMPVWISSRFEGWAGAGVVAHFP